MYSLFMSDFARDPSISEDLVTVEKIFIADLESPHHADIDSGIDF